MRNGPKKFSSLTWLRCDLCVSSSTLVLRNPPPLSPLFLLLSPHDDDEDDYHGTTPVTSGQIFRHRNFEWKTTVVAGVLPQGKNVLHFKMTKRRPALIMELVYGIIWGIYTLLPTNASNIVARIACVCYMGTLDAFYRKSLCKHRPIAGPHIPLFLRFEGIPDTANFLATLHTFSRVSQLCQSSLSRSTTLSI